MRSTSCFTPRTLEIASSCSKRCRRRRRRPRRTSGSAAGTSRWRSARCRSFAARPSTASSLRPRLRIVSIIPGIETAAPERTETSSGSSGSPKRLPLRSSSAPRCALDLVLEPVRQRLAVRHVRAARVGRDREPGRHRHAQLRHLGEADALAAEQLAAAVGGLVEVVDVALGGQGRIVSQMPCNTRRYA